MFDLFTDGYFYFFRGGNYAGTDWFWFILCIIAMIFALIASASVNGTYKKYSRQFSRRGITGAAAARQVLNANGLEYVVIRNTGGQSLSDNYDPRTQTLNLSASVYNGTSTADIGVACHEAGHAIQHAENYGPLTFRNAIVPITNIASRLSTPLIIIGLILMGLSEIFVYVAYAGVICFAFAVLFQLVTLPTEFDASKRALTSIRGLGILDEDEIKGARKVLRSAAMTYVAALAVSLTQLLRFLALIGNNRRRN